MQSISHHELRLAHLYPDILDIHGDGGNVDALRRRCESRWIDLEVLEVRLGDGVELDDTDMIFIGGGKETGQRHVANDLVSRGRAIQDLVERGAVVLAVGAGFQLFGNAHTTAAGRRIPGIGVFDVVTSGGPHRVIGDALVEVTADVGAMPDGMRRVLVGFENHVGLTSIGPAARPLGRMLEGGGNLGNGGLEGAVYGRAIGTYLHGPLLSKNPWLTDALIEAALAHRYGAAAALEAADDIREREPAVGR